jgi:hypothetical protein
MENLKSYLIAGFAILSGIFYILFRIQQKRTEAAKAELGHASFKLVTLENYKEYENAKITADELVNEYRKSSRDSK